MQRINEMLKNVYGSNLHGQQIFRLVFSDEALEKRIGEFNEFYGKIFLRTFRGLREVKKYPHIHYSWVLERWFPAMQAYTPEIPGTSQGSYEPIFTFQDDAGNPLEPTEQACRQIIAALFNPPLPGHRASLLRTADEEEMRKEIEFNRETLTESGRTWMGHRLHTKEGIIRP